MRNARVCLTAAAATGVCALAFAGCGGGGNDTTSPATTVAGQPQLPSVTRPQAPPEGTGGRTSTTTRTTPETTLPPGAQPVEQALAPFRECLSRHGVDLMPLDGSGARARQNLSPEEQRAQIQARIACIPELPPRLRQAAERLKRQYEQRQRNG